MRWAQLNFYNHKSCHHVVVTYHRGVSLTSVRVRAEASMQTELQIIESLSGDSL